MNIYVISKDNYRNYEMSPEKTPTKIWVNFKKRVFEITPPPQKNFINNGNTVFIIIITVICKLFNKKNTYSK